MTYKQIVLGMRRLIQKEYIGLLVCEGHELFPHTGVAIWKPCGYFIFASIDQPEDELADTLVHEYIHVAKGHPKMIEDTMKGCSLEEASDTEMEIYTLELTRVVMSGLLSGILRVVDIRDTIGGNHD